MCSSPTTSKRCGHTSLPGKKRNSTLSVHEVRDAPASAVLLYRIHDLHSARLRNAASASSTLLHSDHPRTRRAFSVPASRGHVRPQRLDLIRPEQVAPRRHGVLALRYRSEEPLALVARELAQIGGAFRIGHARTVACGTVPRIGFRTALHLLGLECLLCRCAVRKGEERADQDCFPQSP